MLKDVGKIFVILVGIIFGLVMGIWVAIGMISFLLPTEVQIHWWVGAVLFSVGTFMWVLPFQVIEWLRFIPVKHRVRRMLYPYFVTLLQVAIFVFYIIGLNSAIPAIHFTDRGLVLFAFIIVTSTKIVYTYLSRKEREIETKRKIG